MVFWLPIFGGWLRNVNDESMPPTFEYAKQTAQAAEQLGFSTTLIAELNLNDIKRCFSAKFRSVDHCGSTCSSNGSIRDYDSCKTWLPTIQQLQRKWQQILIN